MGTDVCIVTFPTTHTAIQAERAANEAGLEVRMIPVPREISSDCNVGMKASVDDMPQLRSLMNSKGIECDLVEWND